MERRSGFLYFAWPVASIAVLFAFPLSFWYVPAWGASFPASRSNSPWPSLPLTPVLQQPPLRQPHSPFTLFLSKILERGKDSRPSLLLPDSLRLHPLSSSSTPQWGTRSLSSLGLLEEVGHLHFNFVFSQGRSKKLRKKQKIGEWGLIR